MRGYGQYCPIAKAAEILAERWTLLVVRELACGSTRFNQLRRGLPLMSSSLLVQRLRLLEDAGLIGREPSPDGRGSRYHLTEAGRTALADKEESWSQLSKAITQIMEKSK